MECDAAGAPGGSCGCRTDDPEDYEIGGAAGVVDWQDRVEAVIKLDGDGDRGQAELKLEMRDASSTTHVCTEVDEE